ncbi:LOW QUALITY PROTEIN: hypothetical protein T265_15115 [Opisthorchis viverrini]|uniref:Uncharacterized protein n=1 Tax=Opisthorchis viverrini TaxID=6198 RepID=A0A074ZDS4_OPIVI|nr:LOW QUALITY PROTEIN: hypothetical protein T265_15115 [Opisthorchis viverrini]KER21345.1 LOW QUALITY PROTEIN: hypothetical protein T265_15115 [Opisthorchis viverrini]
MYRLNANPSTPEGNSSAETPVYRTPRSTFDLLKPPKEEVVSSNQKMMQSGDILTSDRAGKNYRGITHLGVKEKSLGESKISSMMFAWVPKLRRANQFKEAYSQPTRRLNSLPLNILTEHLGTKKRSTTDTQSSCVPIITKDGIQENASDKESS